MKKVSHRQNRPGLLVSVRDPTEAVAALRGGAHVIDVKEPTRGPLGAADSNVVNAVVRVIGDRVPVTAALGELTDLVGERHEPIPTGVSLFKIGLAGCRSLPNWLSRWRATIAAVAGHCDGEGDGTRRLAAPVGVVYADWRSAGAPEPDEVLSAAFIAGCPALLIDTWDKTAGSLFDKWQPTAVDCFVQSARSRGLIVVLAGSLVNDSFLAAARLAPDLVGVRAAACDGGRGGRVSADRVRVLQRALGGEPNQCNATHSLD